MSTLKATASEFVPGHLRSSNVQDSVAAAQPPPWPTLVQAQHQQQLQQSESSQHAEQDYGYADGYYDDDGDWIPCDIDEYAARHDETGCQAWTADEQRQHGQRYELDQWQQSVSQQQQQQQQQQEHDWWREGYQQLNTTAYCHDGPEAGQEWYDADSTAAQLDAAVQKQPNWDDVDISNEQAVQLLQSWYPRQSVAMLKQLMEACNGQMQDALQILSEMEHEEQQQQQQQQAEQELPTSLPHAAVAAGVIQGASKPRQQQPQQQGFSLQQELFPELSAAAAKQPAPAAPRSAAATAAALWEEPRVGPTGAGGSSSNSSWSAVAAKASASAAQSGSKPSYAASERSNTTAARTAAGNSSSRGRAGAAAVPWVETGAAVAKEYADARGEASDYARIRNICFHQATIAFLAGDKALAKELSAKGKQAAEQMWAAHERASRQIFAQRNAKVAAAAATTKPVSSSSGGGSGSSSVIDLHGLHVREVKAVLPQQLALLANQKQQAVSLIVGTGHHTKGPPAARVGPAVEALLQELGYKYRQPQPGLLRVQLT